MSFRWEIITDPLFVQYLLQQPPGIRLLFETMIDNVEKNGRGKKWLFGNTHEIVSPNNWDNLINQKRNQAYYMRGAKTPNSYLRILVEEFPSEMQTGVRIIPLLIIRWCTDGDYQQFQTALDNLHQQNTIPLKTANIYNYDDHPDSAAFRGTRVPMQKTA